MRGIAIYSLLIVASAVLFWWIGGARPVPTERLVTGLLLVPLFAAAIRIRWQKRPDLPAKRAQRGASLKEGAPRID
ncbi:hypothetical protein GCM10022280_00510 [Sphingomonas swuensis]|uniref:Uncharacterized protein n=1 Tax=Sphingomonas swuensis TaxID=977800 RepID=A0ABP7S7B9_9SPHN